MVAQEVQRELAAERETRGAAEAGARDAQVPETLTSVAVNPEYCQNLYQLSIISVNDKRITSCFVKASGEAVRLSPEDRCFQSMLYRSGVRQRQRR